MSKLKYWTQKAAQINELEPIKVHNCTETGDTFYFIHKTLAHEEAANRFCEARLKKKGSKKAPSNNQYCVAVYMILECDKDGNQLRNNPSVRNEKFLDEYEALIENPAFGYHLNGALGAIGEAPEQKKEDERDAKKPSSKAQKEE